MRSMVFLVRACAAYNLIGGAALVTPGALELFGVAPPGSPFWLWLPALLGSFGAIVLIIASTDLDLYGVFACWNAVIRLLWTFVTFALGFGESLGPFAVYLGVGDALLGIGVIVGLPIALKRSPAALLLNRPAAPATLGAS